MARVMAQILALVSLMAMGACATPPSTGSPNQVRELATHLRALDPNVDPEEALRAAQISYEYPTVLARQYQISDPPLVHNAKVNSGLRPRGICVHWAEDMEARLKQENFRTLQVHRAIADPVNQLRIDHSTAVLSARGQTMKDGVVLDPWRTGGTLHWAPVREDTRYNWEPRLDVLRNKKIEQDRQRRSLTTG
ncbi:MAG: hypothetical protein GJ676_05285 [Rhodobacteraceae bacterium]|nr:hypothetical protein [Paracoccaceae bacterium]